MVDERLVVPFVECFRLVGSVGDVRDGPSALLRRLRDKSG